MQKRQSGNNFAENDTRMRCIDNSGTYVKRKPSLRSLAMFFTA